MACGGGASEEVGSPESEDVPAEADASVPEGTSGPTESGAGSASVDASPTTEAPPSDTDTPAATERPADTAPIGGSVPEEGEALPLVFDGSPVHHRYVRLTHTQWENSVADNLRMTEATGWSSTLSPDEPAPGYSNDEQVLEVSGALYANYREAAEDLAARIEAEPEWRSRIATTQDPNSFIAEVGRRFYRRPLSTEEADRYLQMFEAGSESPAATDAFAGGARWVLEAMLQSPYFLYRVETAAVSEPLPDYELASKLSFFITDTTPSDALLDSAAVGELSTVEGVAAAARELLAGEAARSGLLSFLTETHWSGTSAAIEPELAGRLEASSRLFFESLLDESGGVRALLLSRTAFVDASLAPYYGLATESAELVAETLPESRSGYYTQLPFLMRFASGQTPNPIARGGALSSRVLCSDATLVPHDGELQNAAGQTNRERVESGTADAECVACHHEYINPLGYAFENFDGEGRERQLDEGAAVNTSASYPFAEGREAFADAPELMRLLSESQQFHGCFAKRLSQYGLARHLAEQDRALIEELALATLTDESASVADLVVALVTSDAFRIRSEP